MKPTCLTLFTAFAIAALGSVLCQASAHAGDYTYTINNGTITITRYTGPGGNVTIPGEIDGLPVTSIGDWAFAGAWDLPNTNLTSITIPNSVTRVGNSAFYGCTSLTSVTIPDSVTNIGDWTFHSCSSLTNVVIGNSVTTLGDGVFFACTRLTSVIIPNGVTSIGGAAFASCTGLTGVHFQGNSPSLGEAHVSPNTNNATVYYLPGTTGWGTTFGGRPTSPWLRPNPVILTTAPSFGIQTNAFGFRISWATNVTVVVEASTSLSDPTWSAISTNTLTAGWADFSDPDWVNHPSRFYRVRAE